jgi:hypothetical protein
MRLESRLVSALQRSPPVENCCVTHHMWYIPCRHWLQHALQQRAANHTQPVRWALGSSNANTPARAARFGDAMVMQAQVASGWSAASDAAH